MITEPFNGLSPAEAERLAWLAEECAEVIQAVGKILRHGYESRNPTVADSPTNRQALQRELGHLHAAKDLMWAQGDVSQSEISDARNAKAVDVLKWLHHQGTR